MYRRLPPLNAVRAFEAAARLESFTAAAEELGVTHGAVSRQVRLLEDWFGFPLFQRANRKVSLTREGRDYRDQTKAVLDSLSAATERLAGPRGVQVLRLSAPETFSVRWLIPRLSAFARAYPNIEVRLRPMISGEDYRTDTFHAVIRRGRMERPGYISTPFLGEDCRPVISPRLLEQVPLGTPRALGNHTLLHAESLEHLWPSWMRAAGIEGLRVSRQLRFQSLNYVLQAAVEGVGIAIGPSALVADDLASGRLVTPLTEPALPLGDFHVMLPAAARPQDPAAIFRGWLLDEQT